MYEIKGLFCIKTDDRMNTDIYEYEAIVKVRN